MCASGNFNTTNLEGIFSVAVITYNNALYKSKTSAQMIDKRLTNISMNLSNYICIEHENSSVHLNKLFFIAEH